MDEKPFENIINREFSFLLCAGFSYEYLYEKGSDSSCVYIYRFRRGRDFIDFRTISGGKEKNVVVFSDGQYLFPNLALRHKKTLRIFRRKHLFKKISDEELWTLAAELLKTEISDGKLFGITL